MEINEVETFLRSRVATVLALPDADVSLDSDLIELGMDSISFVELMIHIEETLGIRLYAPDIFVQPTVRALASAVLRAGATNG